MRLGRTILNKQWWLLVVTSILVLVACGPIGPLLPTRKPPSPYVDVAPLIPDTHLMRAPSLSANGRYLGLGQTPFAAQAPSDLAVVDLRDQQVIHRVDIGGVSYTAISPTGEYIAADQGYRTNRILYLFEVGKLTPTQVITGSAPAWSPEGQQLAYATSFQQNADWQIQVHLMDIASGKETTVFERNTSQAYILPIAWSPDGGTLAFSLNYPPDDPLFVGNLASKLFLLDIESETITLLAENWDIRSLQFSPDGSKLLFLGARLPLPRSPRYRLYVLNEAGNCHQVAPPFRDTTELALSAGGNWIAISVETPDWLLVAPTTEALPEDFWEVGDPCPPLSE